VKRTGLIVGAGLIRLLIALAFPGVFAFDETGAIHGSGAFDTYAVNLLNTGVYGLTPGVPDAILPPGYSYTLAAIYGLFGRSALTVIAFHIALDLLAIFLLTEIGRRLFPRDRADWIGLIAGALYALYPYLIFQNLTLIDTPLFMALLYTFILSLIGLRAHERMDRRGWLLAICAGGVLGAMALVRPNAVPFAVFGALWFLFRRNIVQTFIRLAPVALISLCMIAPWFVRNTGVYGTFVTFSVNSGSNFFQGNNPQTIPLLRAGYDVQWTTPPEPIPDSPEGDRRWFALTWDYLRSDPRIIPELAWVKFLTFWSIDIAPRLNPVDGVVPPLDADGNIIEGTVGQDDPVAQYQEPLFDQIGRTVHRFYFGALLVLSLIGIGLTRQHWRDVALLWFAQISMTLVYVAFHPSTRYRVPTDPLLFLFAAFTICSVVHYCFNKRIHVS